MSLSLSPSGKWDARYRDTNPHDTSYYAKSMAGGLIACGITHAVMTPLDVTKCNMQVNPIKYRALGSGLSAIVAEEGSRAIWKGIGPTVVGYSCQGAFKYGLYEVFKDLYMNIAGEDISSRYKGLIWMGAAASAEGLADFALCPFEMTKVKVQTSPAGTFPLRFLEAMKEMNKTKAVTKYPFGSVVPLWSRQIPYTVSKFFFFEKIVSLFYTHVFTKPKETYSSSTQLGITFGSGYLAGIICAVVSHPADSLVSLLGKAENKGKSAATIARETGLVPLVTKGLGARVVMIGTLTGFQWWIYDSFKSAMGLETTGGK
ncbi:mitochondrial carrier protein [Cylindrobasidium torrendii FP15055 ss-10]|uniref:Mitochondrial carrier protein n=1 Tax=Cylindrobasidium torrendii FP15055 ss-10 TaxID=1314674 RepID=A0A0D7BDW5_9AGAR|nr:mitochondrial carrier protein [Cylindrobasidium torrendii FP15055 ss-10]